MYPWQTGYGVSCDTGKGKGIHQHAGGWEPFAYTGYEEGGGMGAWDLYPNPGPGFGQGVDVGGWGSFPSTGMGFQGWQHLQYGGHAPQACGKGSGKGRWEFFPSKGNGKGHDQGKWVFAPGQARAFHASTFDEEKAEILRACTNCKTWDQKVVALEVELRVRASPEVMENEEVALACMEAAGYLLRNFKALRADRRVMLAVVTKQGSALEYASEDIRADREVVLAAVASDGEAIQFANQELQSDKEVMLAAARNTGKVLRHASVELRADKEAVLAAVATFGIGLRYASWELQADKEVVLAAVRHAGEALEAASQELRADKEVVMAAASTSEALSYASSQLHGDKDFVLLFARQASKFAPHICYHKARRSLREASSESDFCLAAESALAMPGQPSPAPLITVTLTRVTTEPGAVENFHAEARLALSGEELNCDLPVEKQRSFPPFGVVRGEEQDLNDLAQELVALLRKTGKVGELEKYIFLSFQKSGSDDLVSVTPWDCQRPLSDFLATNA